jgi:DNA modification methylase
MFPTKSVYESWQRAANGDAFKREHDAFKREHDDLKREFYATRAYFDNTHDNMTDVWDFLRVAGEERHGHATPKPVDMIARCVKSSCPDGGLVFDGFSGSGTTIIACHNLGRKARCIEISPAYCAVAIQRFADAFPSIEIKKISP